MTRQEAIDCLLHPSLCLMVKVVAWWEGLPSLGYLDLAVMAAPPAFRLGSRGIYPENFIGVSLLVGRLYLASHHTAAPDQVAMPIVCEQPGYQQGHQACYRTSCSRTSEKRLSGPD